MKKEITQKYEDKLFEDITKLYKRNDEKGLRKKMQKDGCLYTLLAMEGDKCLEEEYFNYKCDHLTRERFKEYLEEYNYKITEIFDKEHSDQFLNSPEYTLDDLDIAVIDSDLESDLDEDLEDEEIEQILKYSNSEAEDIVEEFRKKFTGEPVDSTEYDFPDFIDHINETFCIRDYYDFTDQEWIIDYIKEKNDEEYNKGLNEFILKQNNLVENSTQNKLEEVKEKLDHAKQLLNDQNVSKKNTQKI